jgi:hypothetical protein
LKVSLKKMSGRKDNSAIIIWTWPSLERIFAKYRTIGESA